MLGEGRNVRRQGTTGKKEGIGSARRADCARAWHDGPVSTPQPRPVRRHCLGSTLPITFGSGVADPAAERERREELGHPRESGLLENGAVFVGVSAGMCWMSAVRRRSAAPRRMILLPISNCSRRKYRLTRSLDESCGRSAYYEEDRSSARCLRESRSGGEEHELGQHRTPRWAGV